MATFSTKYGFGIAVALIAYFLLTKLAGLHGYPILSAFNGVIFGVGILYALVTFKKTIPEFNYADGFQVGLFTGGIASIVFSVFMAFYIFIFDQQFAHAVLDSYHLNFNKGSLILVVSTLIMGFSTTCVLTLAFMQLLKESWNQKA